MPIFKCKMCGGDLEIAEGASIAECQYCGTKQTVPRMDSERKANLYDRANHFRRNNEFDKAEGIYEQILNEDPTDAEAYWSLVLCRYGIEYVEDPATHKRVPTVNRAQYTSVFADENYKKAAEYADTLQRVLYEEEAKTINEIQRGILEISEKEEPFDIFICYKETDAQGNRTPDSVLAYDLYAALVKEGYRVFFSRVTLEDKLGTEYEPYIFAALNSAKAMIVLGTKREYFNAPWVKNEWSRYLALIRSGAKKYLIPVYRDMDPYDLPEEFSHLQGQDMGKLGAVQDIVRGLRKLIGTDEPKKTEAASLSGFTVGVERLLQNAETYMKLKEAGKAEKSYFDAVRDYPEDYRGWWGQITCSALRIPECSGDREKLDTRMKEMNKWYGHVRQLCPESRQQGLEKQYVEHLHQAAILDAGIKRTDIERNVLSRQRESVTKAQHHIAELEQKRVKLQGAIDREVSPDQDKAMRSRFDAEVAKAAEAKNKANALFILFIVLAVIPSLLTLVELISLIPDFAKGKSIGTGVFVIIVFGIPLTLLWIEVKRRAHKLSAKDSDLQGAQNRLTEYRQRLENTMTEHKLEMQNITKTIQEERERIEQIQAAIPKLEQYIREHNDDFVRFYHAQRCREIGVSIPAPDSIEIPEELRIGAQ